MSDNSSEEDYMSDVLLNNLKDFKPGVHSSRSHQRLLIIEANRDLAKEKAKVPKKAELERDRLEEGLSKPICTKSKGFSLLSKMGYKPGMSLGRKREGESDGIKEPIGIQFKNSKTGLGHETEKAEKQKEKCLLHLEAMSRRAHAEAAITDDFRTRKRFAAVQKQLIADLKKAQKTCEELDLRLGAILPNQPWFWPIHRRTNELKNDNDDDDDNNDYDDDDDDDYNNKTGTSNTTQNVFCRKKLKLTDSKRNADNINSANKNDKKCVSYFYGNGSVAPEEFLFMTLSEQELYQSLDTLVAYIRQAHNFCIWCGCLFISVQDLEENCPGPTRDHHDISGNDVDD